MCLKLYPVIKSDGKADPAALQAEYAAAEDYTPARIGTEHFFFRAGLRTYYLPLRSVRRVFRRVEIVNARMACCGNGLPMESIVLCGEGDAELVQVRMETERLSKALLAALEKACPEAESGYVRPPEQKTAVRHV